MTIFHSNTTVPNRDKFLRKIICSPQMVYKQYIDLKDAKVAQELFTFRSTLVHSGFQQDSCSSIFSFLCSVQQIIACPFTIFFSFGALPCLTIFDIGLLSYSFGIFETFSTRNNCVPWQRDMLLPPQPLKVNELQN